MLIRRVHRSEPGQHGAEPEDPHRRGVSGPAGAGGAWRVAVFRALQLGDLLCAVPAWRALRAAMPRAELVLIGLPWAEAFVQRYSHLFDDFVAFPGHPSLPEQPPHLAEFPRFLAAVQARRFDLVLQMHGSGRVTNPLVHLFGGVVTAGFCPPGGPCPDPVHFLPQPTELPEVRRHLRLMEFLEIPLKGEDLEFPLDRRDVDRLATIPEVAACAPGTYACIHPGARSPRRRWPAERFAAVGDALHAHGLTVIVTGSMDEAPLARAVIQQMRAPAIHLAGRTDLGTLAALLSGARLLVCNDTGVSHLAAALKIPSVVIAITPDPWAPLDTDRHRTLFAPPTDGSACHPECVGAEVCGYAITPDGVLAHAMDLLAQYPPLDHQISLTGAAR